LHAGLGALLAMLDNGLALLGRRADITIAG
jgi:hypothetical protein